jgi:hypothetical protein
MMKKETMKQRPSVRLNLTLFFSTISIHMYKSCTKLQQNGWIYHSLTELCLERTTQMNNDYKKQNVQLTKKLKSKSFRRF